MKYTILIAFIGVMACRQDSNPVPPEISNLASSLFDQVQSRLDYSTLTQVTGKENVAIWMVQFKNDPNRVYAASDRGELLYERHLVDANNGYIDVTKNGETARIDFKDGSKSIAARTLVDFHGGIGFCQREKNEQFSDCFKAESEEFCDSFVSCIALATQPSVAIIIGIACSCNATK